MGSLRKKISGLEDETADLKKQLDEKAVFIKTFVNEKVLLLRLEEFATRLEEVCANAIAQQPETKLIPGINNPKALIDQLYTCSSKSQRLIEVIKVENDLFWEKAGLARGWFEQNKIKFPGWNSYESFLPGHIEQTNSEGK